MHCGETDLLWASTGSGLNMGHCCHGATHVWLEAIGSASVADGPGRLDRLAQGDGVRLVLLIHLLTVVQLWLTLLYGDKYSGKPSTTLKAQWASAMNKRQTLCESHL